MQNPCDKCIYQSQSWNTDPCCKCGSENDYIYGEDANGNLLHPLKEHVNIQKDSSPSNLFSNPFGKKHLKQVETKIIKNQPKPLTHL